MLTVGCIRTGMCTAVLHAHTFVFIRVARPRRLLAVGMWVWVYAIKKGLTLARPEIVPFRLTPSMVGGMGLCGFEGVYRRVMETCMSVLRTNRETLLSVLEPFLQARKGLL